MDIVWILGIWALFFWYAIIVGTAPVILVHRLRALWVGRKTKDPSRIDSISLALFDAGIIGVTGWLLYITIQYVQIGQYGIHAWKYLLLIHLWSGLFAMGLILRTAIWRSSWRLEGRK